MEEGTIKTFPQGATSITAWDKRCGSKIAKTDTCAA